jgi:hypothetical protein
MTPFQKKGFGWRAAPTRCWVFLQSYLIGTRRNAAGGCHWAGAMNGTKRMHRINGIERSAGKYRVGVSFFAKALADRSACRRVGVKALMAPCVVATVAEAGSVRNLPENPHIRISYSPVHRHADLSAKALAKEDTPIRFS